MPIRPYFINKTRRRGFTLIELLVVIGVIGVLASVVLSALGSARDKSKIAKAKSEANQLMIAANLVFSEYGYYPNDSHGSIVCPKDIIVDQATGKTWGNYINICNDPWGNPYEWDNKCGNGSTRKPHAPFDSGCLSFSESDPGPLGVTVVGADRVNNNCTGDDVCTGIRGHEIYAGGGASGSGGGGSGLMCVEIVADCASFNSLNCALRDGCTLGSSSCTGSYTGACTSFVDQTSCSSSTGCSWSTGGCAGTPPSCGSYGDSSSCGSASGCSWSNSCSGTVSCSTYNSDQTTCSASGCSFSAAACGGSYACSQWNGTNSTTCTSGHPGCTWSSGGGGKCNGGSQSCSSFSQASCTISGCSWGSSSCLGTPSCSPFGSTQCSATAGCAFGSGCSGSASSCTGYSDSSSCSTGGCAWTTPSCQGTYSGTCGTYSDQTSCQAQAECAWTSGACSGSAASCGTFGDQNSCSLQSGCSWQ